MEVNQHSARDNGGLWNKSNIEEMRLNESKTPVTPSRKAILVEVNEAACNFNLGKKTHAAVSMV